MSTGWGYRAIETAQNTGDATDWHLDGSVGTAFRRLVTEVKAITGVGTGPWSVEAVRTDGVNFEVVRANLEEGTGPGGKDVIKRTTGTLLRTSNGGSAVNWGSNVCDVFLCPAADKAYALFDALSTAGLIKRVSATSFAIVTVSSFIETLLDDAAASNARTTLSAMDRAMAEQSVLTTRGDLLIRNASAAARLALGASGRVLRSDGTDSLWAVLAAADVAYTPTSPLTGTTAQAAIDQLAHALSANVSQGSDMGATDFTTETVITDLANITIPGTQDTSKKYRVRGGVTVRLIGSTTELEIRVRVGTAGTTADAETVLVGYWAITGAPGPSTIPIPGDWFQLSGTGRKVTITLKLGAGGGDTSIGTVAAGTRMHIEQIRNA